MKSFKLALIMTGIATANTVYCHMEIKAADTAILAVAVADPKKRESHAADLLKGSSSLYEFKKKCEAVELHEFADLANQIYNNVQIALTVQCKYPVLAQAVKHKFGNVLLNKDKVAQFVKNGWKS